MKDQPPHRPSVKAKELGEGLSEHEKKQREYKLKMKQRKMKQKVLHVLGETIMSVTVNKICELFIGRVVKVDPVQVGRFAAMLVSAESTRNLFVGLIMYLEGGIDDPIIVDLDDKALKKSPSASNLYNLNTTIFYQRLIDAILSNDFGGNQEAKERVEAHLQMRKKKVAWQKEWAKVGEDAGKCTFVHVMLPDSVEAQEAAKGKDLWSNYHPSQPDTDWGSASGPPPFVDGNDMIIDRYLKRRKDLNVPHLHIILNTLEVEKDPSLAFLLKPERDPLQRLTLTELLFLDTALGHATNPIDLDPKNVDEVGKLLLFARVDVESWAGWKKASKQMRDRTKVSVRLRKSWKRKTTTGTSVGMGTRPDFRGNVGPYANFKNRIFVVGENEEVLLLQQEEATMCDFLLSIMGGAIPGLLKFLQRTTADANVAGAGICDVVITVAAMVAFDSKGNLEPLKDPWFTSAICLGAQDDSQTPGGGWDFGLTSVDGGRGLVIESGPGTLMVWPGKFVSHATVFANKPYHQESVVYQPTSSLEPSQSNLEDGEVLESQTMRLRGGARPIAAGRQRTGPNAGKRVGTCSWQGRQLLKRAAKKAAKVIADLNDAPIIEAEEGASFDLGGGIMPRRVAVV
ncbi:hypothetical protein P7C70_g8479, partial [Phenoliferia sp. Uapishka_3]